MIRVVIVDGHLHSRQAFIDSLALEEDIEVVATFADGRELLRPLGRLAPDVLLVDLEVPNLEPVTLVSSMRRALPSTRVLVLAATNEPVLFRRLLDVGAAGIQLKTDGQRPAEMVRVVHRGSLYLSSEAARRMLGYVPPHRDRQGPSDDDDPAPPSG
jgi:two-component system response regulator DesR